MYLYLPQLLLTLLNGFLSLPGEFADAAEMYREVLRSSEEHKARLKTDSLQVNHSSSTSIHPSIRAICCCFLTVFFFLSQIQRLHATHNLMELLNAKHPGIPPTLRDDSLKEEVG